MNDYEKELAVHDYIVGCASYDETHLNALGIGLPNSDNPYGCLINGKAICSGYSTTFQLFMDMLEIPVLEQIVLLEFHAFLDFRADCIMTVIHLLEMLV